MVATLNFEGWHLLSITEIQFTRSSCKLRTAHSVITVVILINIFNYQKFRKSTISSNGWDIFQFAVVRFLHEPLSINIYGF